MPTFPTSGSITPHNIGERGQIESQQIEFNGDLNQARLILGVGLRSGETVAETTRADLTVTLDHKTSGGTDFPYTWSNQSLVCRGQSRADVAGHQAITGLQTDQTCLLYTSPSPRD